MPDQELMRMLIKSSSDAGFYKGLLESLMMQMKDKTTHHELDTDIFNMVEQAMEDHK
jgi:hypothetical protein